MNFQDTVKGYDRLVLTPYGGGELWFFKDSTVIRTEKLNAVEYMEER